MCHHAGFCFGGAGQQELSRGWGAQWRERLSGFCGLCCVFSLSASLLLLFPLFAVLLNCPYLDPPVSACFFPSSSAFQQRGGAAAWRFCCWPQPNHNIIIIRTKTIIIIIKIKIVKKGKVTKREKSNPGKTSAVNENSCSPTTDWCLTGS